jgi:hypothetical protein
MAQAKSPPRYSVYLLRCWQERDSNTDVPAMWRFSLEDSRSGKRVGFSTIETLMHFLQAELEQDEVAPAVDDIDPNSLW